MFAWLLPPLALREFSERSWLTCLPASNSARLLRPEDDGLNLKITSPPQPDASSWDTAAALSMLRGHAAVAIALANTSIAASHIRARNFIFRQTGATSKMTGVEDATFLSSNKYISFCVDGLWHTNRVNIPSKLEMGSICTMVSGKTRIPSQFFENRLRTIVVADPSIVFPSLHRSRRSPTAGDLA
jgi:hypothetical protein